MRRFVLIAVLTLLTLPAAATETYTVDATHSEVGFQIRHLVTKVRGEFTDFDGTIHVDRENPADSSVTFTIDAASIDTNNQNRDEHLRSADFFDVANHPKITFTSSKVEKTGEGSWRVTGTLTMHGVAKEIILPVTYLGEVRDPRGQVKAGFETEITLNRKDFGINWNAALDQGGFVLGDEVEVEIGLQAAREASEAAAGGG